MATYAVHDGETVVNILVADTAHDAEEATGLAAVEVGLRGGPGIGWTREGDDWRSPDGVLLSQIPDTEVVPESAGATEILGEVE